MPLQWIFLVHTKGAETLGVKFTNITTCMFYSNPKNVFGFAFKISNVFLVVMEKIIVTNSIFSHILVMNCEIIIMQDVFILNALSRPGSIVTISGLIMLPGGANYPQDPPCCNLVICGLILTNLLCKLDANLILLSNCKILDRLNSFTAYANLQ